MKSGLYNAEHVKTVVSVGRTIRNRPGKKPKPMPPALLTAKLILRRILQIAANTAQEGELTFMDLLDKVGFSEIGLEEQRARYTTVSRLTETLTNESVNLRALSPRRFMHPAERPQCLSRT